MTALTLYYTSQASSVTNAAAAGTASGGTQGNGTLSLSRPVIGTYLEMRKATGLAGGTTLPAASTYGQLLDSTLLEDKTLTAGTWTGTFNFKYTGIAVTGRPYIQVFKRSGAGVYTSLGSGNAGADVALTTSYVAKTITFSIATDTLFTTGDKLYFELYFVNSARPGTGTDSIEWYLATTTTGVTTAQLVTPGYTVTPTTYSRPVASISAAVQALDVERPIANITAALSGPGPFVLYGSATPDSTLTSACQMVSATTGGVETSKLSTVTGVNAYAEVFSKGSTGTPSATAIPATPPGNGWVFSPGAGTFASSTWTALVTLSLAAGPSAGSRTIRFFKYSGGAYTPIGSLVDTTTNILAKTTYTLTGSLPSMTFAASDLLYIDLWFYDASAAYGDNPTVYEATSSAAGVANEMQITTPTFTPFTGTTSTRSITSVSAATQALGIARSLASISVATNALGIEKPISGVSGAVQALGLTRPIIGVSGATQALGLTRPVVGITSALQALGLTRPVINISSAVQTLGVTRPIPGVSCALQALGIERPIMNVSGAVSAPLTTSTRTITGISAATQALGLSHSVISVSAATSSVGISRPITGVSVAVTHIWYVSGAIGSSGNGTSWATAWKTFADIAWGSVQPGDSIEIDGGASSMTYSEVLTIGVSGTVDNPITIRASQETGHNGTVIQDGGRTTQLPYASQSTGSWSETAVRFQMLRFGSYSYITVDGSRWHGWQIKGAKYDGVDMDASGSHRTLRFLDIFDCGTATSGTDGWATDRPGVRPAGDYLTIDACDIHDNGQDAFQTGSAASYVTVKKTWLHNTREHPDYPGYSWNQTHPSLFDSGAGTHNDGYQNYTNPGSNMLFEDCLFGPGLMHGMILEASCVNNTLRQCLFFPMNRGTAILMGLGFTGTGWLLDAVTIFSTASLGQGSLWLEGTGNSVTNSIIDGGRVELNNALSSNAGNIQYNCYTSSFASSLTYLGGTTVNPNFLTDVSTLSAPATFAQLHIADFAPQAAAAIGKGCTDFTSIDSFLTFVGAAPVTYNSRTITGVGAAVQALGIPRPISGVSAATLQPGITRNIINVSASASGLYSRTISGVSAATLQPGLARTLVGISASLSVTYTRSMTSVTTAVQAFGVVRTLTGVSAAVGVAGLARSITGVSAATKQIGATCTIPGVSAATIQVGIARSCVSVSASVALTHTRAVSGVSSAIRALGLERPVVSVSAATKALGVTRSLIGITGAIGQGGIERSIISVSVALQAFGVPRTIIGVSSALQAIGLTRSLVGISGTVKQTGLTRDITGVSVALAQTVSRTVIGVSGAVQALALTRPIVNVSSSVTLRTGKTVTGVSSAVKALGVPRTITGILGAIGVAGIVRPITGVTASLSFSGKMYTYITVVGTRGNVTVEGTRGTITALGSRGTITVQEE